MTLAQAFANPDFQLGLMVMITMATAVICFILFAVQVVADKIDDYRMIRQWKREDAAKLNNATNKL